MTALRPPTECQPRARPPTNPRLSFSLSPTPPPSSSSATTVIVESTYGVSRHLAREVRERRFLDKVTAALQRGGRVLLPVVALGRAQELLLMLDEHWARNKHLQRFPIYQASGEGGGGGDEERGGGGWCVRKGGVCGEEGGAEGAKGGGGGGG